MGSFGNMDQVYFDPSKAKLLPQASENGFGMEQARQPTSEELYKAGVELEFDPSQSKLVPKTSRRQNADSISATEQAYKQGQEFDFDPASGILVPKKKETNETEQQKTCQPRKDSQKVKVGKDKRRPEGFF